MIRLTPREGRTAFRPGEEVAGTVSWRGAGDRRTIAVRLLWSTYGKCTPDSSVAAEEWLENLRAGAEGAFRLRLPEAPFSFRGRLVALLWRVEATSEDEGAATATVELDVSPTGREVLLCPEGEAVPRVGAKTPEEPAEKRAPG